MAPLTRFQDDLVLKWTNLPHSPHASSQTVSHQSLCRPSGQSRSLLSFVPPSLQVKKKVPVCVRASVCVCVCECICVYV